MYLVMLLCAEVDGNDSMVCLNMDEALGQIILYVEPNLIHHTEDNKGMKEIWDTFKIPFRMVNMKENFKDP